MECSFRVAQPAFHHQRDAEPTPPPDGLPSLRDLARQRPASISSLVAAMLETNPIEIRPIPLPDPAHAAPSVLGCRIASARTIADAGAHLSALAYLSDFYFSGVALAPHHVHGPDPQIFVASLDHALWIHHRGRVDDWLLYDTESPAAAGGTGLSRGLLYDRGGRLVATSAQESVMVAAAAGPRALTRATPAAGRSRRTRRRAAARRSRTRGTPRPTGPPPATSLVEQRARQSPCRSACSRGTSASSTRRCVLVPQPPPAAPGRAPDLGRDADVGAALAERLHVGDRARHRGERSSAESTAARAPRTPARGRPRATPTGTG